jgi:tape measure domain-containing protein
MKIPGMYVEIRGDYTALSADFSAVRREARATATDISNALANAVVPSSVTSGIDQLYQNLTKAQRAAKLSGSAFASVGVTLDDKLRKNIGLTDRDWMRLQQRMLATKATQQAERALKSIARAANMSAAEMAVLKFKMGDAEGAMRDFSRIAQSKFGMVKSAIFSLQGAVASLGLGMLVKDIFDTGAEVMQLNRAFEAITGSTQGVQAEFAFLRQLADELGMNFYDLAGGYKDIAAAAKGTSMEGEAVRGVFTGIVEAGGALGMTAENVKGSLYAVSQMISKGKVSAEELRRQLGDRLPGAFQLAAKAMDVSTAELDNMLKQGELFVDDFLPRFEKALHERYGDAARKASGDAARALDKFKESWVDIKLEMANSGFLDDATAALRKMTDSLKEPAVREAMRELAGSLGSIVKALGEISRYAGLRSVITTRGEGRLLAESGYIDGDAFEKASFIDRQRMVDPFRDRLPVIQLDAQIAELQKNRMGVVYARDRAQITARINELKAQKEALERQLTDSKTTVIRSPDRQGWWESDAAYIDVSVERRKNIVTGNAADAAKAFLKDSPAAKAEEKKNKIAAIESAAQSAIGKLQNAREVDAANAAQYSAQIVAIEAEKARKLAELADKPARGNTRKKTWEDFGIPGNSMYLHELNSMVSPSERSAQQDAAFKAAGKQAEAEKARNLALMTEFAEKHRQLVLGETEFKLAQIEEQGKAYVKAGANEVAVAQWAKEEKLQAARDWESGAVRAMRSYHDEATDAARGAERMISDSFKTMEDAVVSFAMTGKLSFSDFADSVIKDMMRMVVQQGITGPLAGGMGDMLGGMMGGGGGIFSFLGSFFHDGGVIGRDAPSFTRPVDPAIFAGAPRYHSGLLPDEFPAILQEGETVIPKGGFKVVPALRTGGGVTVNVYNNSGNVQARAVQRPNAEGGMDVDVIIEEIDRRMAEGVSNGTSRTSAAIERVYGNTRSGGLY